MKNSLKDLFSELPGCAELPPPPRELFEKLRQRRGESYRPRTRHLRPDGFAQYTNRLFLETSPYLLQHAHNPVNWFPWGDEAFELARRLNRPVLVSIGYATCHWCHVMEEESFEDLEIAAYLNANFIAVKVDREERPDIDTVYMTAVHAMGTQGGWPLNVFVTPERTPFYGGTYFPPTDHTRGIGFPTLLRRLRQAYDADPQRVQQAGQQLTEAVRSMLTPPESDASIHQVSLELAVRAYANRFDPVNGGLLGAPKFPSSLPVRLLLRQYRAGGDREVLSMVELSLKRMAAGGIYDQVAGGFHRYATDEHWLIPHFEKMLYDNALLAVAYLEGYQATGDQSLAVVVREILRYLQRDLMSPEGAFFAATDADSLTENGRREEGFFFTWTPEELSAGLGSERARVVAACYGITKGGNFEGRSLPHRALSTAEVAGKLGLSEERVKGVLQESREILYQLRSRRPLPLRDEKILASWNGLAVSAFARAGLILDDGGAVEQGRRTASFLLEQMTSGGRLAHSHQEGEAKGEGFLDDYAFCIAGLLDLFEVTGEALWLERSIELAALVQEEFEDRAGGGFFMTGSRHEELISKEKPAYDGVVPSGNAVMVMNLLRLHFLTEQARYLEQAKGTLDAFASQISGNATAFSEMLLALDFLAEKPKQIAIVAPGGNRQAAQGLLAKLRGVFLPNRVLAIVCEGEELERAGELAPFLKGKKADGDRAVAYLCENRSCRLPTGDAQEFERQLKQSS
jgi:uncharacterized protein YyaL (SSP411 family)